MYIYICICMLFSYGVPMVFSWFVHGCLYGFIMVFLWHSYKLLVLLFGSICYVFSIAFLWSSCGFIMGFLGAPSGSLAFLWLSCGFPMAFLWLSYDFRAMSQWFSCGFRVVFLSVCVVCSMVAVLLHLFIVFLWLSYDFCTAPQWFSCGFPMAFLSFSFVVLIVVRVLCFLLWCFPIGFLWFAYGFPWFHFRCLPIVLWFSSDIMMFLWHSYGFPIVFL